MQTRLLHEDNGQRTFAVILETGEEVLTCLQRFVTCEHLLAAQITAIGALSDVVLMYFDWDKKDYLKIRCANRSKSRFSSAMSPKLPRASRLSIFIWSSPNAMDP